MCTLVAKESGSGWILASNSDNPYTVQSRVLSVAGPGYTYLATSITMPPDKNGAPVPWSDMLTRGVNSAGLAFTYAYVEPLAPHRWPRQQWTADLLAEEADCASAVDLMRRRREQIIPGNYLLADRRGEAVLVEVAPGGLALRTPTDGLLSCTNVWEELLDPTAKGWAADTASAERAAASHQLAEGSAPARLAQDVLTDHSGAADDDRRVKGSSICNHGRLEGTISSEVLEPEPGRLWWSFGWPCGGSHGHEAHRRQSWGRFLAFDIAGVTDSADLTTPHGELTAAGATLVTGVRVVRRPEAT